MPYRSADSRITNRQLAYEELNDQISGFINATTGEWEAEALWLAMRASGNTMSQPTFYNHLKKVVASGLVQKRLVAYNKYLYRAVSEQ